MEAALDDIASLANSENRVAVFGTLVEASRSRDEVREQVDASRVTVARILRELEARGWIEHSGNEYAVTPRGEWVCEEVTRLIEEMEAEQRLREPLQWFPSDLLTFDVQCLRDAELILLDGSDTTAVVRRIVEFHRSGERVRGISPGESYGASPCPVDGSAARLRLLAPCPPPRMTYPTVPTAIEFTT